jgi:hypothetical protein
MGVIIVIGEYVWKRYGINTTLVTSGSRVANISIWVSNVTDSLKALLSPEHAEAILSAANQLKLFGSRTDGWGEEDQVTS